MFVQKFIISCDCIFFQICRGITIQPNETGAYFWVEEFDSDKDALKAAFDALVTECAVGFWEEDSFLFVD